MYLPVRLSQSTLDLILIYVTIFSGLATIGLFIYTVRSFKNTNRALRRSYVGNTHEKFLRKLRESLSQANEKISLLESIIVNPHMQVHISVINPNNKLSNLDKWRLIIELQFSKKQRYFALEILEEVNLLYLNIDNFKSSFTTGVSLANQSYSNSINFNLNSANIKNPELKDQIVEIRKMLDSLELRFVLLKEKIRKEFY